MLIDFVMLRTDMKLTKSYVEKIASHWTRKQIKTVKDAMDLAKNEHRTYLEWSNGKKSGTILKSKNQSGQNSYQTGLMRSRKKQLLIPDTESDPDLEQKNGNLKKYLKSFVNRRWKNGKD